MMLNAQWIQGAPQNAKQTKARRHPITQSALSSQVVTSQVSPQITYTGHRPPPLLSPKADEKKQVNKNILFIAYSML